MGLQWVRLDANVATHDKVLALISDPSTKKWQAISSYFFALGWSGGQGTDGFVPAYGLGTIHGTTTTARLLVKYGLWDEGVNGWTIRNFASRQELTIITEAKRLSAHMAALKANCIRWHGPDCHCWKTER
jgi:hypothetical protein